MDRYEDMIFDYALKNTNNREEAEDITQEAFLRAFESLSTFRGESKFSTWVYRITQNLVLEKYRSASKKKEEHHKEDMQHKNLTNFINPEILLLKKEMANKVRDLVAKLPKVYKKPLVYYYFDGMSYQEIAKKMDIKMNTLKSYIFRGKELIREWMGKDEFKTCN
jgi:RNA polymerase sigma-70 factor (ECF subfamily)